jgi:hypothetical protein
MTESKREIIRILAEHGTNDKDRQRLLMRRIIEERGQ